MPDGGARPLADRTAVVTGGTRGIGWAVARALADAGARLLLLARGREGLDACLAELRGGDGIVCDVTRDDEVERAAATIVARTGGAPDL
nr:SDR family NAD(P)-dependent oxidoreductase [Gemmatimonadaceae bacterium]